jgi:hypothetical protein
MRNNVKRPSSFGKQRAETTVLAVCLSSANGALSDPAWIEYYSRRVFCLESSSVAQGDARSNLTGQKLRTSFSPWPFIEDGAQSLVIEPQTESVFLRKLGDLCLSIFLVWRPETLQFVLVNSAMLPSANLQFVLDSARKRLHIGLTNVLGE